MPQHNSSIKDNNDFLKYCNLQFNRETITDINQKRLNQISQQLL